MNIFEFINQNVTSCILSAYVIGCILGFMAGKDYARDRAQSDENKAMASLIAQQLNAEDHAPAQSDCPAWIADSIRWDNKLEPSGDELQCLDEWATNWLNYRKMEITK